MKHARQFLKMCGLACALVQATPSQENKASVYPPRQQLRNYALSACLSYAFPNSDAGKDAAAAAAGYLELGTGPLEAYTAAAKLAQMYVQRDYLGKAGTQLQTMKCVDLYRSQPLDRLAAKYFRQAPHRKRP